MDNTKQENQNLIFTTSINQWTQLLWTILTKIMTSSIIDKRTPFVPRLTTKLSMNMFMKQIKKAFLPNILIKQDFMPPISIKILKKKFRGMNLIERKKYAEKQLIYKKGMECIDFLENTNDNLYVSLFDKFSRFCCFF